MLKISLIRPLLFALLFLQLCQVNAKADHPVPCQQVNKLLDTLIADSAMRPEIDSALARTDHELQVQGLSASFCRELELNLAQKEIAANHGAQISAARIIHQAIFYERFRIETFIKAGVAPKRYFGFFDQEGDTAEYENILRKTVIDAVRLTNQFAEHEHLMVRVSEKEVAVTFLAEGGALILTNPEYSPNKIHPVRGIGLDNFRLGFKRFAKLVDSFDQHFGTKLNALELDTLFGPLLLRPMTFREAILGTALMYLYEKELAADMMLKEQKLELQSLSFDRQFIATSLVYNSGVLFSEDRVEQIRNFDTAQYLDRVNRESKRPKLEVYSSQAARALLQSDHNIPQQLTSWSAVYHILQRYGAWVALEKFSDVFAGTEFKNRA